MSIVLDTNVLVSGLLRRSGPPGRIVDLVVTGQVRVTLDARIFSEYCDVLLRPEFGFSRAGVLDLVDFLWLASERVVPKPSVCLIPMTPCLWKSPLRVVCGRWSPAMRATSPLTSGREFGSLARVTGWRSGSRGEHSPLHCAGAGWRTWITQTEVSHQHGPVRRSLGAGALLRARRHPGERRGRLPQASPRLGAHPPARRGVDLRDPAGGG